MRGIQEGYMNSPHTHTHTHTHTLTHTHTHTINSHSATSADAAQAVLCQTPIQSSLSECSSRYCHHSTRHSDAWCRSESNTIFSPRYCRKWVSRWLTVEHKGLSLNECDGWIERDSGREWHTCRSEKLRA